MKSRKKVLEFVHSLTTGGAELLAERIGRHFANSYDVVFACLDEVGEIGNRLNSSGYRVEHLRRQAGIDLGCARRLCRLIREEQVDLIHAHQYTPFFYAMMARVLGAGRPTIFTEHGRFLPDYPRYKRILFNRLMMRRCDRVTAVGHDVKRALVENEGLPKNRIQVIYNGVSIEAFDAASFPDARRWLRCEVGLPDDAIVVVQVARLDYLKDHCTAVRAFSKVDKDRKLHLAIVGEGPQRAQIEQSIKAHHVADRVHLLGLREDVPRILAGSDILLLTSISEGIPLTLIEGMAARLPIVSTQVGGVPEIITDNVHGRLCPAGDATVIAAGINALAAQSEVRQRMGEAGYRRSCEQFSECIMNKEYLQVANSTSIAS